MTGAPQIPERSRPKGADAPCEVARVRGTTARRRAGAIQPTVDEARRHGGSKGGEERHGMNHLESGR